MQFGDCWPMDLWRFSCIVLSSAGRCLGGIDASIYFLQRRATGCLHDGRGMSCGFLIPFIGTLIFHSNYLLSGCGVLLHWDAGGADVKGCQEA